MSFAAWAMLSVIVCVTGIVQLRNAYPRTWATLLVPNIQAEENTDEKRITRASEGVTASSESM